MHLPRQPHFLAMYKLTAVATIGLLSLAASALPQGTEENVDPVSCPFNGTIGPNILLASVECVQCFLQLNQEPNTNYRVPDSENTTEIGAWIFGRNWCSNYNKITSGTNVCVERQPDQTLEFVRIPLSDKFGNFDTGCYANVDIAFSGCDYDRAAGKTNYRDVVATVTSKDGLSEYTYQCVDSREHRGCLYDGQLATPSETEFTAFLMCGIRAEP